MSRPRRLRAIVLVMPGALFLTAAPSDAVGAEPVTPRELPVATSAVPSTAAAAPSAAVTYTAPVTPLLVLRRFDPPASLYGPGHRGVDLAAPDGTPVRAAGAGTVAFAGRVAGRGVVVIAHRDGVRTEYEPLTVGVATGASVTAGVRIGVVHGRHAGCPPGGCLHWGARRRQQYLDPLSLLWPLGPVRLLPWR